MHEARTVDTYEPKKYSIQCTATDKLVADFLAFFIADAGLEPEFFHTPVNDSRINYNARVLDFDVNPLACYLELAGSYLKVPTMAVYSADATSPVATMMINNYVTVAISKDDMADDFKSGFKALFAGQKYTSPRLLESLFVGNLQNKLENLTTREVGILVGYALDMKPKEIAKALNIASATVSAGIGKIKKTHNIKSTGEFAAFLNDIGLNETGVQDSLKMPRGLATSRPLRKAAVLAP